MSDLTPKAQNSADSRPAPLNLKRFRSFTGGNKDVENELINLFVDETEKILKVLAESASASGENKTWHDAAHMLKGSAANFGADALSMLCREAEHFIGDLGDRMALYEKVRYEYARVENYLREQDMMSSPK